MSLRHAQKGFSIVEALVVAGFVVLIVALGYRVYTAQLGSDATDKTSQQAQTQSVPEAPEIKTTEDLDTAQQVLDQMETEVDSTELRKDIQTFN